MKEGVLTLKIISMFLRRISLPVFLCVVATNFCYAQQLFVTDHLTAPVRTGPSIEYKIVAFLKTGDKVELMKQSQGWSFVRFSEDREGWVLSRYLGEEMPSFLMVQDLESELKTNRELLSQLREANSALERENKIISPQLAKVRKDFAELQEGATNYLRLKKEHEDAQQKIEEMITTNEQLITENKALKDQTKMEWFLFGAGVVFLGWFIGLLMGGTSRKRKPRLRF